MPSVTVVVPTFNRRSRLQRLVAGLDRAHRAGSDFDVVVAVDGSTDGTLELLDSLTPAFRLEIIVQPNGGPAAARNAAIAAATGEVLVFLDDDVVPVDHLIERHLAIQRRDPLAVVTGPMVPPPGTVLPPWLLWEARTLQKQYDAMRIGRFQPTARQFYTANASVRRAAVVAAGGFDERLTRAEDVELAYRLADRGARFYFDEQAVVYHEPDRTLDSWLRVAYEYGRYAVFMAAKCGHTEELRVAFAEWPNRHPINRLLPRICVGRSRGRRLFIEAASSILRRSRHKAPSTVQLALCSVLVSVQYWQGIADASGLGAGVWKRFDDVAAIVRHAKLTDSAAIVGLTPA
jgi:GT2 family glycosyltransferase